MPIEEHNAPGFYYIVKWRRLENHAVLTLDSIMAAAAAAADQDESSANEFEERTIDGATGSLSLISQPVYKPYIIYVLAANEIGEAASEPVPVIGFSSEAGRKSSFFQ